MTELTEQRREALQEMINIGFGRSMASLSDLLGVRIELSVPDIQVISSQSVLEFLVSSLADNDSDDISLVQQAFRGDFFGEAVLAMAGRAGQELVVMLGEDSGFQPALEVSQLEMEALLEVGNVVIGACLGQFAELLETSLSFNPPSVTVDKLYSPHLRDMAAARPGQALLIRTQFEVDQHAVTGYLLVFLPEDCLAWLYREVDSFLERML